MALSAKGIRSAAMTLPLEVRARLAHELVLSLESELDDESVEEAWEAEIESRLRRVLSGDYEARDWEASLAQIRSRLDTHRRGLSCSQSLSERF